LQVARASSAHGRSGPRIKVAPAPAVPYFGWLPT
jgi:hypothetical protein